MNAPESRPTAHLPRVDVLRAVAILLVFTHHYWLDVLELTGEKWDFQPWNGILLVPGRLGFLGVKLFFVISGFCIHLSWLNWRKGAGLEGAGVRAFLPVYLWRRFWRIYPPYLLALLVFFLMQYSEPLKGESLRHLSVHALMLQNLSKQFFENINPSFWSLGAEWQLYLVYPLALVVAVRWRMEAAFALTAAVALGMRAASFKWGDNYFILHSPFSHWLEWMIGALVADRFAAGTRVFHWHSLLVPALIVLTVAVHLKDGFVFSIARYLVPTLTFAALLEWCIEGARPLARAERALIPLGLCSYSFYLLHEPAIPWTLRSLGPWFLTAPAAVVWLFVPAAMFAVTYAVSRFYYRWVEGGSIEFGRRLWAWRVGSKKGHERSPMPLS